MPLNDPPAPPRLRSRLGRGLYAALGLGCVGLGFLGVFLPGLPTTPFILLAGFFFVRSSPRLHAWLEGSRLFGPFLRDWRRHRGIRLSVKLFAVAMVASVVTLSVVVARLPDWARFAILGLAAVGILVILRLPTIPADADAAPPLKAEAAERIHEEATP